MYRTSTREYILCERLCIFFHHTIFQGFSSASSRLRRTIIIITLKRTLYYVFFFFKSSFENIEDLMCVYIICKKRYYTVILYLYRPVDLLRNSHLVSSFFSFFFSFFFPLFFFFFSPPGFLFCARVLSRARSNDVDCASLRSCNTAALPSREYIYAADLSARPVFSARVRSSPSRIYVRAGEPETDVALGGTGAEQPLATRPLPRRSPLAELEFPAIATQTPPPPTVPRVRAGPAIAAS